MTHTQEKITYPCLPLAIYRELAAHLSQIEGVTTELISQQSQQFDYEQSQIDHLKIAYPPTLSALEKQRLEEILNYYAQIHNSYTREVKEYCVS
ncbi:hypothetical protein [Crocosphaera sp.]|uniref:hypothetical protein n=1 Tax=Crocosphaera sp. TaxID=2729996 RepID=UPI002618E54F|nr:hypothetical protein [Crocosphaera sp.]MDJ0578988.1 hypothetical protein [Crocosphaera sp.]